jgi:hypothetical protein
MTTETDILNHRRVQVFRERLASYLRPELIVPELGECHIWQGHCSIRDYGVIRLLGRNFPVHRVAYAFANGPIPPGDSWDGAGGYTKTLVLHRCDVKRCANPAHLFLGSTADNVDDKMHKGRGRIVGTENYRAKLTDDEVRAIRADPRIQAEIAAGYAVNQQSVSNIKTRKTWSHVPD